MTGDELAPEAIARVVEELADRARRELGESEPDLRATYELRYEGQSFELPVGAGTAPTPDELRRSFEDEHESRYGYRDPGQALELVTIRVTATSSGADVALAAEPVPEPRRSLRAAARVELEVVHGPPPPGAKIVAPAVIELAESTVLVPDGWLVNVDRTGTIQMRRRR
jgi:N-methylhydantoinase A/oxoprolinase/acetone carboxylase beta subunit